MIRIRNLLNGDIRTKWRRDFYDAGYGPFVPFGALGGDPSPVINWDFLQSQSLTSFSRTSNATLFDSTGKLTYAANNLLLNTATLSTQTVTTGLQAGVSVILSFSGTGSVAISGGYTGSLAGTGVSDRVSLKFTTTTNSLTFTVTGSVTSAQLEVVTYQTTPSTYTATTSSQYYGPRYPYAYNGSTWDAQGLLAEAAATNLVTYSEAFSNAAWTPNNLAGTPSADVAVSPSGVQNADKIIPANGSNANPMVYYLGTTTSETRTSSCYVKAAGYNRAFIRIGGGSPTPIVVFLLSGSGSIEASQNQIAAGISEVGNGWYRIWVTYANSTSAYGPNIGATSATYTLSSTTITATGNGTDGIFAWGFQTEVGDLSSYIPNLSTGTTTRNADTSLAFSAISLPTGLSFSRASNAMQYDAAGRLTYAANNLLTYSQDFRDTTTAGSTRPWTWANATAASTTATTAPDGSTTAYKALETATTAIHQIYQLAITALGTYEFSFYAKSAERSFVALTFASGDNPRKWVNGIVNLDTGAYSVLNTTNTPTYANFLAVSVGNGWYRISLQFTNNDTASGAFLTAICVSDSYAPSVDAFGRPSYAGDTAKGVYVWGAQVEAVTYQTTPSTYVATTTSAYYGPRYDYDPTTRLPKGLLVEEGRTNVLTYSQTFATDWTDTNITRVSTTRASPDGTGNALEVSASAGNATIIRNASVGSSAARTLSIWMRRVSGTGDIQYTLDNGSNWTTQAVTTTWARYSFAATTADQRVGFRIVTSGDAIQIYGAQLEAGSFPTSYIPNPGIASGIRSADIATLTGTALTTLQGSASTSIVEYQTVGAGASSPRLIGSGPNGWTSLYMASDTGIGTYNGAASLTKNLGTSQTAITRSASTGDASGRSITGNNLAVTSDTNAYRAVAVTSAYIGSDNGSGSFASMWTRKVGLWNVRLTDAKLQTKSVVGATL